MKKFLIALIAAALLSVGCISGQPMSDTITLPAHIQYIEDHANKLDGPSIKIIDYRDDDNTLWLWVDNSGLPGTCDYVGVLGIVDKAQNNYETLFIYNSKTAADPCQDAYAAYYEYLEEMNRLKGETI